LVAEGSGGHLIPALQVAESLAKTGVRATVWYARRHPSASLADALVKEAAEAGVEVHAILGETRRSLLGRLWQGGQLWSQTRRWLEASSPDVVVGFGGWVSAPVILAARWQRIHCMLHEQNVAVGRANRWLVRWVDRVAVSFQETQHALTGTPAVVTGMPVREAIGRCSREAHAARFGFSVAQPTLLVLGGSQGSRAINRIVGEFVERATSDERRRWQFLHITGAADEADVHHLYARHEVTAWVAPFLVEMDAAYAQADVVIARAGAATITELARCGKPALLIPYPYAGGHQLVNARLVEQCGGGLVIEEGESTAMRLLSAVRRLLADDRLRLIMGQQMRGIDVPDAAERLTHTIMELHAERRTTDGTDAEALSWFE
jgi:UDP-N-acetylglucosamine--N-acetylmuramyl-(pentapeptide) pyrophosphoryl-undecaprenol N-acetylglucosamine transferase